MIDRREFQLAFLASFVWGGSSRATDVCASISTRQPPSAWTQWGGLKRNFSAPAPVNIDVNTDANGDALPLPKLVWKRAIGKGHAAIVSDGEFAYSLRLEEQQEVLEKWSLDTGDLIWASRYPIGFHASTAEYDGPHATPVLTEDHIFAVGIDAGVHAIDLSEGEQAALP